MLYRVAIYQIGEPSCNEDDDYASDFEEQHDLFIPEPGGYAREIPIFLVNRFLIAQPLGTQEVSASKTYRVVAAEAMRRAFAHVHEKLVQLNAPAFIIKHWSNRKQIASNRKQIAESFMHVHFAIAVFPCLWEGMIDHYLMGLHHVVVETSLNSNSVDTQSFRRF